MGGQGLASSNSVGISNEKDQNSFSYDPLLCGYDDGCNANRISSMET